jgi:hypothetical protein
MHLTKFQSLKVTLNDRVNISIIQSNYERIIKYSKRNVQATSCIFFPSFKLEEPFTIYFTGFLFL